MRSARAGRRAARARAGTREIAPQGARVRIDDDPGTAAAAALDVLGCTD